MNENLNRISDKATQAANWLKKQLMENWRLVLVAAIVIIISFNGFQNEKDATNDNNQPSPSTQAEQNNANNTETAANTNTNDNANTAINPSQNTAISNNPDQTGVTQTAQKGEGITHLARRAVKGYLEQNGKTLTNEQKIYAEDYVRKNTPAQKLNTGSTITFSEEIIKIAVEKSGALTEKQIKNLKKFVPLAKNL